MGLKRPSRPLDRGRGPGYRRTLVGLKRADRLMISTCIKKLQTDPRGVEAYELYADLNEQPLLQTGPRGVEAQPS